MHRGNQSPTASDFDARMGEAAEFLKLLANERRLLVLSHLYAFGEASVGTLVDRTGLSQSALSQHLAKLREEGLVTFRRESQTLYYRLSDERAARMIATLQEIF